MIDGNNDNNQNKQNVENKINGALNDVKDETNSFSAKDIYEGKVMAFLSYCGPLVLIPYLVEKTNPFAKYHAKIGMNLLIIELFVEIARFFAFINLLEIVLNIALLGCGILAILGIVNVLNGKAKELPIVNKINVIK